MKKTARLDDIKDIFAYQKYDVMKTANCRAVALVVIMDLQDAGLLNTPEIAEYSFSPQGSFLKYHVRVGGVMQAAFSEEWMAQNFVRDYNRGNV